MTRWECRRCGHQLEAIASHAWHRCPAFGHRLVNLHPATPDPHPVHQHEHDHDQQHDHDHDQQHDHDNNSTATTGRT